MIERWNSEDVELLTGARVTWNGFSHWEAVSAEETAEGWILILENAEGKTATLSPSQMAQGPIVWGPRPKLTINGKPRPTADLRAEANRILRTLRLTARKNYART